MLSKSQVVFLRVKGSNQQQHLHWRGLGEKMNKEFFTPRALSIDTILVERHLNVSTGQSSSVDFDSKTLNTISISRDQQIVNNMTVTY